MNKGRLQFRHFESVFETREKAYKYLEDIVNNAYGEDNRLDESLMAEPIVVVYKDADEKPQAIVCIGVEGEKGEGALKPYHIIDSAKLEEDIQSMSGSTGDIEQELRDEISRATEKENSIQSELDLTQAGAGLESDGSYRAVENANYISTATSLRDADAKLDVALKSESDRATEAENTLTTNLNTLSAATQQFSAATVAGLNTLTTNLENEISRATAAENSISGVVNSEISRATEKENSLQNELDATQAGAGLNSDGTYKGHDSQSEGMVYITTATSIDNATVLLDKGIQTETGRATLAEQSISGVVNTFSAATEAFSAATVAEITRLDAQSKRNKVKSTGNTIVVTEATEGTNLEVNVDAKTILSNNGELKTGLKVASLAPGELESNVREAFRLVDNEGTPVDNTIIKIYKSSSLVSVELINVGGIDYVRITYIDNEGATRTMDLNIKQLIFEAEFKDGLVVNENGEVRVKIDPTSEAFLTVSSEGVKVSGLQNAINTAVAAETARATNAENSISGAVDTLSAATEAFSAGTVAKFELMESEWNVHGSIKHTLEDTFVKSVTVGSAEDANKSLMRYYNDGDEHKYYVSSNANDMYYDGLPLSTVIKNMEGEISQSSNDTDELSAATISEVARLDGRINDETTRATAAENSISGTVNTLSAATESEIERIEGKLSGNERVVSEAINQLKAELDRTEAGAGLNGDGTYTPHNTAGDMGNYITNATSLDEADMMLDSALKALENSMTGSTSDINELSGQVETFSAATESAISNIQSELDTTQAGAGLNEDGTYHKHNTAGDMGNYIANANSLDNADMMLDSALKAESDRAIAAEESISGIVNTFSAATESEIERIEDKLSDNERVVSEAINQLKAELDRTEAGAGLNGDGTYTPHNTAGDMANYIANATSLDEADVLLDVALKDEETRATNAENSISGIVNTFSAATESIIETLRTELQTLSGVVETIESQMADNIYSTVKAMLQGTSKQIKVTPDDANEQITIGFADDAIFGENNG